MISHNADSPFEKDYINNLIKKFIEEKQIVEEQIENSEVIIFQENHSLTKTGMNIVIKIMLKNGNELKKELSVGLNKIVT